MSEKAKNSYYCFCPEKEIKIKSQEARLEENGEILKSYYAQARKNS